MTPIDFIKENNLEWQPSFSRSINSTLLGYRGALIIQDYQGRLKPLNSLAIPKLPAKRLR